MHVGERNVVVDDVAMCVGGRGRTSTTPVATRAERPHLLRGRGRGVGVPTGTGTFVLPAIAVVTFHVFVINDFGVRRCGGVNFQQVDVQQVLRNGYRGVDGLVGRAGFGQSKFKPPGVVGGHQYFDLHGRTLFVHGPWHGWAVRTTRHETIATTQITAETVPTGLGTFVLVGGPTTDGGVEVGGVSFSFHESTGPRDDQPYPFGPGVSDLGGVGGGRKKLLWKLKG